ncbi:MAG: Mth938-like domain-containing protein [Mariprofundaceae bacterium]|nr:Mth938-like domain-containing protein [Mariprofundaceae bacterium]
MVIGTGRRTIFPDVEVLDYLSSLHIGYECMDSRSAARTFNLLVGEGRIVSVAMFLANVRD